MEFWNRAREITAKVRKNVDSKLSFLDRLGNSMLKPWPGIPIALLVILLSLGVIVGGGKILQEGLLLPWVNKIIVPFLSQYLLLLYQKVFY